MKRGGERMAEKRPRDPLSEPIVRPYTVVVELIAFRATAAGRAAVNREVALIIAEQKIRKLALLAERFGVSLQAPNGALELCLRLAEEHYEGFKTVDLPPRRVGAPKKDYWELVKAIWIAQDSGETVAETCRKLSRGRWKGHPPKSLEARYYQWVDEDKRRRKRPDPLIERLRKARLLAEGDHRA